MNAVVGIPLLLSVVVLTIPASVRAELRYQAPSDCPAEEDFVDEVSGQLARVAFREAGEALRVEVQRDVEGGFHGVITHPERGARSFASDVCSDLIRTMAVASAMLLEPTAGSAADPPEPRTHRLRFHYSGDRELVVSRVVGRTRWAGLRYETVCAPPCTAYVPDGPHFFAVGVGVRGRLRGVGDLNISQDVDLELHHDSRSDERVAGVITLSLGVAAGIGVGLLGLTVLDGTNLGTASWSLVSAGMTLGTGALITGLALLLLRDELDLRPVTF